MRNHSTIDMLVENALRELEYEFESEAGVEFDAPAPGKFFKWVIYTLENGKWKRDREERGLRLMLASDANDFEQKQFGEWARKTKSASPEVGVQRCWLQDDNTWASSVRCKRVNRKTGEVSSCGVKGPPIDCEQP